MSNNNTNNILYYSKFCKICDKYLQILSRWNVHRGIHFVCIDNRVKEANNKTYIVLENGQRLILPETVTKVPALLLLQQNYRVLYGEQILEYLKPRQQQEVQQATQNNMEPMAFSIGNGGNVVSDNYSFLDQSVDDMGAEKGNGGIDSRLMNMHNYVDLQTAFSGAGLAPVVEDTTATNSKKMGTEENNRMFEAKMKQMQEQRDADIRSITGNRPPVPY